MRKILLTLFIAAAALLYAAPILFMVFSSFKPDSEVLVGLTSGRFFAADLSWQNYADVFARVSFGRYLFNSLFITIAIVVSGLLILGCMTFYFFLYSWNLLGYHT